MLSMKVDDLLYSPLLKRRQKRNWGVLIAKCTWLLCHIPVNGFVICTLPPNTAHSTIRMSSRMAVEWQSSRMAEQSPAVEWQYIEWQSSHQHKSTQGSGPRVGSGLLALIITTIQHVQLTVARQLHASVVDWQ